MKNGTKADTKTEASKLASKAEGAVHLALLLDESGSMHGNQEAVVTGVNEFLASFRKNKKADVRVWLAMFDAHPDDDRTRVRIDGKPIHKVASLRITDYVPRGSTPLNDAVLDTIGAMSKRVGKGERAMVVILTDGLENASEANAATVAEAIRKAEKKGWTFLYIGANQHSETSAAAIGLGKKGQAVNFTSSRVGTQSALRAASHYAGQMIASDSAADYQAKASALYDQTGGVIPEDEDES